MTDVNSPCTWVAVRDVPEHDLKRGLTRIWPKHELARQHPDWFVPVRSDRGRQVRAEAILDHELAHAGRAPRPATPSTREPATVHTSSHLPPRPKRRVTLP